jgi:hypothetical protein
VLGISGVVSPSLNDAETLPTKAFEVWDDCWESVIMFTLLANDWTYAVMGSCTGMNKQTLQWYMEVFEVKDKRAMLEDLQAMESHALTLMNKDK